MKPTPLTLVTQAHLQNLTARLLKRKTPECIDPVTGCWIWNSGGGGGYGGILYGSEKDMSAQKLTVNRASYIAFVLKADIPQGMCVCHKCDRPRCFNPDHLWLGTQGDNLRDAHNKLRKFPPSTRFTPDIVREIRTLNTQGIGYLRLAKQFGTTKKHICRIVKRRLWKCVA